LVRFGQYVPLAEARRIRPNPMSGKRDPTARYWRIEPSRDVALWHFADIAQLLHDFRSWGVNGHPSGIR
jgi:hypothetical protein